MVIESRSRSNPGARSVMSTLSLVDLAGSESVRLANTHGQRQIEGGFINKSLLTLGKVVSMLTEEGEGGFLGNEKPARLVCLKDLLERLA